MNEGPIGRKIHSFSQDVIEGRMKLKEENEIDMQKKHKVQCCHIN